MEPDLEKTTARPEELPSAVPQDAALQIARRLEVFLAAESNRLLELHRNGAGGLELARARAQAVDEIVCDLYGLSVERFAELNPSKQQTHSQVAIAAASGYGRGELCPYSGVALLILYDRSSIDFAPFLAETLLAPLREIGLRVTHSLRTVNECLEASRNDFAAENGLLEARYLAGGVRLWEDSRSLLGRHWSANAHEFVARAKAAVEERGRRLGATLYAVQPDVKESPGGLRDFHTMTWLARGVWLLNDGADLVPAGVLSEAHWEWALRGYDWMLRVRTSMHYCARQRADQLTTELKREVASSLGYREQHDADLFMRDYYVHAENIHRAMRLALAAALRLKGKAARQVSLKARLGLPLVRAEEELRLAENASGHFPASARDMIRVLSLAQELDLQPGEDLMAAIWDHLPLLQQDRHSHLDASSEFLAMLRRAGRVGGALRAMQACGLLGAYIPEFGNLARLTQPGSPHRHTTGEETLSAIDLLDEIWRHPPVSMEHYRELTYYIPDPAPLYLSLLLHDISKGLREGDAGGPQHAAAVCKRLGMSARQSAQVELLVRQGLLLSQLSQRRELSDRRVAQGIAATVGDLETLSMLCLLNYAAAAAEAPEAWTEWKNTLLWELYTQVRGEILGLENATAQEEESLAGIRARVLELLQQPQHFEPQTRTEAGALSAETAREWMEEHLSLLPPRYPLGHRPELIAKQIVLAKRAAAMGPSADLIPLPEEGCTQLLICCPDAVGLFARVAGALAALEVNIMGARLGTRKDGMAVDILWISTPAGSVISELAPIRRIGNAVEGVLKGTVPLEEMINRIDARRPTPAFKRPQVSLNNEISEACTVLEVLGQDRLGFAYSIANCLTRLGLSIQFAKLSTEKTLVCDVFYLTGPGGEKLPESGWEEIISGVENALLLPT